MTGATITGDAVKAAVTVPLLRPGVRRRRRRRSPSRRAPAGALAAGYNGDVVLSVTFTGGRHRVDRVASSAETEYVGDVAYEILFPDHRIHLHRRGQRLRCNVYQPCGL